MQIRVFIVEDHPAMQQAYSMLIEHEPDLELCGMAGSGEEALQALVEADCHVVIVDVSLPGMNGIEFVTRLAVERPLLPAVVISGHTEDLFARRALEAGARAYVSKPDLGAELPGVLRRLLRSAAA